MSMRPPSRFLSLLALTSVCLGAGGCGGEGHTDDGHGHHDHSSTGASCPSDNAPTAQDFGQDFLQRYCLSCHSASVSGRGRGGAPTDLNYDTLEEVRRHAEAIDAHAAAGPGATNTAMPPPGLPQPTLEERQKLGQWLACGAK